MSVKNNQQKKGFTLIEVTLFLALTVALFFPLIVGTTSSISRQRYQDAVNDVYSYLQNTYSEVENLVNANEGGGNRDACTIASTIATPDNKKNLKSARPEDLSLGRSNCAIYGKVFFFLPTEDSTYNEDGKTTHTIVAYDVLGDVIDHNNDLPDDANNISAALRAAHADYLACENNQLVPAGATSYHTFQWDSSLETTSPNHVPFQGALLIVRSPLNGAINSLFINTDGANGSNNIVSAIGSIRENGPAGCGTGPGSTAERASLYNYLSADSDPKFKTGEDGAISICVASPDMFAYGGGSSSRRNIQVNTDVPASSRDVKLLNQDDGENQCQ